MRLKVSPAWIVIGRLPVKDISSTAALRFQLRSPLSIVRGVMLNNTNSSSEVNTPVPRGQQYLATRVFLRNSSLRRASITRKPSIDPRIH